MTTAEAVACAVVGVFALLALTTIASTVATKDRHKKVRYEFTQNGKPVVIEFTGFSEVELDAAVDRIDKAARKTW